MNGLQGNIRNVKKALITETAAQRKSRCCQEYVCANRLESTPNRSWGDVTYEHLPRKQKLPGRAGSAAEGTGGQGCGRSAPLQTHTLFQTTKRTRQFLLWALLPASMSKICKYHSPNKQINKGKTI